eukprot:jgi/Bigna1/139164/aug1.49_g13872
MGILSKIPPSILSHDEFNAWFEIGNNELAFHTACWPCAGDARRREALSALLMGERKRDSFLSGGDFNGRIIGARGDSKSNREGENLPQTMNDLGEHHVDLEWNVAMGKHTRVEHIGTNDVLQVQLSSPDHTFCTSEAIARGASTFLSCDTLAGLGSDHKQQAAAFPRWGTKPPQPLPERSWNKRGDRMQALGQALANHEWHECLPVDVTNTILAKARRAVGKKRPNRKPFVHHGPCVDSLGSQLRECEHLISQGDRRLVPMASRLRRDLNRSPRNAKKHSTNACHRRLESLDGDAASSWCQTPLREKTDSAPMAVCVDGVLEDGAALLLCNHLDHAPSDRARPARGRSPSQSWRLHVGRQTLTAAQCWMIAGEALHQIRWDLPSI